MTEAIVSFLVALVAIGGAALRSFVRTRFTPQRLSAVLDLTRTVVIAAEKVGIDLEMGGPEKYAYAEQAIETFARRLGVRLKPEETNALVHAVLMELDTMSDSLENYIRPDFYDQDDDDEDEAA